MQLFGSFLFGCNYRERNQKIKEDMIELIRRLAAQLHDEETTEEECRAEGT